MTEPQPDFTISADQHQLAEALASSMPTLLVAAKRVAATVSQGVHGRRRVGQGETFWQFRRFEQGDSRDRIDWRQSAKSTPLYVRETEWEAAQSVWLWPDLSGSMLYRSSDRLPTKAERAALLTMAMGWMLVAGGERVALLGSGESPGGGRAAMNRLAGYLASPKPVEDRHSLPQADRLARYGRLVMIGDFLSPLTDIRNLIEGFASQGVRGHIMQVLDPAERRLPFKGRIQFEGLEDDGSLLIGRAETLREGFEAAMKIHSRGIAGLCQSLGWSFAQHYIDQPPETALMALYQRLSAPSDTLGLSGRSA